jgi:DNA-binding CsgD family transcriptional regulator
MPAGDSHNVELPDVDARAAAAMSALRDLIPWDGYALTAWDAGSGTHRHVTLASEGYPPELDEHMNDAFVDENPGFRLLHTQVPHALRWRDLQKEWHIPFAQTRSAEGFLIPAGFKEGATMCLRLPGGRYTGALHVSWAHPKDASNEAVRVIERFRPLLADVCDLLKGAHGAVRQAGSAAHAVVVSKTGATSELPGHTAGPILGQDAHTWLMSAVGKWAGRPAKYLWADSNGACHRIELSAGPGASVVVVERRTSWPFGLSSREVQILHWVTKGYSNPQIAKQLFISPRTVSTHVEHLLFKLGSQSRVQLAVFAVETGLLLASEM